MASISAFIIALLFGAGLILAGMANPAKVTGFLDLFGKWDPSLMLVMAGAIGVATLPFAHARKRASNWLGGLMDLPNVAHIDRRLVLGSMIFGVGWGLAGICPGPGLVALGTGEPKAYVFLAAMLLGMAAYELLEHRRTKGVAA